MPVAASPAPAPPSSKGPLASEPEAIQGYYSTPKIPRWWVAAFVVFVTAAVVGLGYFAQSRFKAERHAVEDQLRSVAELKVSQMEAWWSERLGDAAAVANLPGLAETLTQMSAAPGSSPPRLQEIDTYLNAALRAYSYREFHLLDKSLRRLRSYPGDRVWDGVMSIPNREALLHGNGSAPTLIEDLHLDETGSIYMHLLVPVRTASGDLAGVVVLSIASESALFPFVQSWPVESASAETLLVRRDGDSVLYLNPLRHQPEAAMRLRLPLSDTNLLAAKVFRAAPGVWVAGNDYRGVPVVGLAYPVEGTSWMMISKVDESEAHAELLKELWEWSILLILILLILILFGRGWLNVRQRDHINQRLESEKRRRAAAERLAIVMRNASDVIILFDESMRVVEANESAVAVYGHTLQELRQLTARDLRTAEAGAEVQHDFALAQRNVGLAFETMHCRKDGTTFPVDVRSNPVLVDGRRHVLSVIRDITLQKQAREQLLRFNAELEAKVYLRTEELSERNHEIEALLESIPDLVLRIHVDGRVLNFHSAKGQTPLATLAFGHESPSLSGEALFLRATAIAVGRRAVERGSMVAEETKLTLGASILDIEVRASPIGAEGLFVFVRDVTERRRLEDALQKSQERLELAARASNIGIWDYDVLRGQLVWDKEMFRLYGMSPEKFSANFDDWVNALHPDDRQRGSKEIEQALAGEVDFDTEFRVVWPDGSIHHIRARAHVKRDAAGNPQNMMGTNRDITREVESAAALIRSESILQKMFQATPMGFLLVDNRTDAILQFNRRFCEIWGIEHLADAMLRGEMKNNDIIPHCLAVLVDVPAFAASCAGLQNQETRVVLEDEIPFTEGRTIRRMTTQIRDAEDRYYGRFYVFEDITPQRRLERVIAANLEKERQISEMKTRFISVTSHEFRTPMTAAMGSVALLANHFDRLAPPKRQELLGRVTTALNRMTEMLDEVLILNRMDANRVEMNLAPVNLGQQLHEFIEEIRIGDRDAHTFDVQVSGKVEDFATDLNLLHHIGLQSAQ